jgi:hypothetical protein
MIELIKELKESLKGRIKNRFTGTLIITLITFNWKSVAVILFSSETIENRIHYIKHVYPNNQFYLNILIPLLLSVLYTPIIQWINVLIDSLSKKPSSKKRQSEQESYVDDRNSEKIKAQVDFELEQVKNGFKNQEELNLEIKTLKGEIEKFKTTSSEDIKIITGLNSQVESLTKDVVHYKHKLNLETIDKNEYRKEVRRNSGKVTFNLENDIQEALIDIGINQGEKHPVYSIVNKEITEKLIEKGLIEELIYMGKGNASIELTPHGENVLNIIQKKSEK